jgi:hypothetical protein
MGPGAGKNQEFRREKRLGLQAGIGRYVKELRCLAWFGRLTHHETNAQRRPFRKFPADGKIINEIAMAMNPTHLAKATARTSWSAVPYQSTHNTGGTIMGTTPGNSVTNKYGLGVGRGQPVHHGRFVPAQCRLEPDWSGSRHRLPPYRQNGVRGLKSSH